MYQQRSGARSGGQATSSAAQGSGPGKRSLVEGLPAGGVQRAAAQGMSGPAQPLPHASTIQRLFGRHDVSGIQAHVGGAAAEGAQQMGAKAYATGDAVAFRDAPDLHTAAHEAAHVVQQRGGVQLAGGVGQVGDPYEQHADAVADLVAQGSSAEPLLDRFAGASAGAGASSGAVQREVTGYDDLDALVADVAAQAGPLTLDELDWLKGVHTRPFPDTLVSVLGELDQRRRTPKVTIEKRKDTNGKVLRMYATQIAQTGTREAIEHMLTVAEDGGGVYLSADIFDCNSSEQKDLFIADWQSITLPDLDRLQVLYLSGDNELDKKANCLLVAEHELVHLAHTWTRKGAASTFATEFFGPQLGRTIAELQELVPGHDKPSAYLRKRLQYVVDRKNKTGDNNEAPAVMRELRRYLEQIRSTSLLDDDYQPIYDRIKQLDDSCTRDLHRKPGESDDQGCCVLF